MNKNNGFKTLELLIITSFFIIVFVGFGIIGTGIMGNYWYTESGVLRKIQISYPDVVRIVDTERNIWSYSKITVQQEDGTKRNYYLDTDVFYNYEIRQEK